MIDRSKLWLAELNAAAIPAAPDAPRQVRLRGRRLLSDATSRAIVAGG